ncbi:MAG: hypothetical protein GY939_27200, partial [Actinomycetia bacterium]|nr:hypothetical protein [Actinomycetes bacterium]
MKTILLTILLALAISGLSYGQKASTRASAKTCSKRHALYFELGGTGVYRSFNYNRIIPLTDKTDFVAGIGYSRLFGQGGGLFLKSNVLIGGPRHCLEWGIEYEVSQQLLIPSISYRYQGPNGILIRVTAMYLYKQASVYYAGGPVWFGVSLGYSFNHFTV